MRSKGLSPFYSSFPSVASVVLAYFLPTTKNGIRDTIEAYAHCPALFCAQWVSVDGMGF